MIPIPPILQIGFGLYIANHVFNSLCSQGPKGDGGPKGIKGDRGPQGVEGDRGPRGAEGREGKQGLKGFAGIMGAQGPQGVRGERGIPGLPGERGVTKKTLSDNNDTRKTVTDEAMGSILASRTKKYGEYPTKSILFKDGLSGSFTQVKTSIDK